MILFSITLVVVALNQFGVLEIHIAFKILLASVSWSCGWRVGDQLFG